MEVLPSPLDFFSLEFDEDEEGGVGHIDLRCRRCEAGVGYWPHATDRFKSIYHCNGDGYICGLSWNWYDIHLGAYVGKLHHFFYTEAEIPTEEMWKLALEEHMGQRAFHFLRKATWEDRTEEALKRLEIHRRRVAREMGGG